MIQGVLMGFTFNPEVQPLQSAPMTDREATSVAAVAAELPLDEPPRLPHQS